MKTKFVIPLTIVFSLLFIAPCFADDFSFIKYPDGTAALQNYYGKDIDVEIPSEIDGYQVTAIAAFAFYDPEHTNGTVQRIVIPEGVTLIDQGAFLNCTNLQEVVFPSSLRTIEEYAFYETGIEQVILPEGLQKIGDFAFHSCHDLISVEIPASIRRIGSSAFGNCEGLASVLAGDTAPICGRDVFTGTSWMMEQERENDDFVLLGRTLLKYTGRRSQVFIPEEVETIAADAFNTGNGPEVERLTLGSAVTTLSEDALRGMSSLSDLVGGENITYAEKQDMRDVPWRQHQQGMVIIGSCLFGYAGEEDHITIPEGITCIVGGLYSWRNVLSSVNIPNSVTVIGNEAFAYCQNIENFHLPAGLEEIGENPFYGCGARIESDSSRFIIKDSTLYDVQEDRVIACADPEAGTILIPETAKELGAYSFAYCNNAEEIIIPDGVRRIHGDAFRSCENLSRMNIPDSVTLMDHGVFYDCPSLKEVSVGNGVSYPGARTFDDCPSLTSVSFTEHIKILQVRPVGGVGFDEEDNADLVLSVPSGSVAQRFADYHRFAYVVSGKAESGAVRTERNAYSADQWYKGADLVFWLPNYMEHFVTDDGTYHYYIAESGEGYAGMWFTVVQTGEDPLTFKQNGYGSSIVSDWVNLSYGKNWFPQEAKRKDFPVPGGWGHFISQDNGTDVENYYYIFYNPVTWEAVVINTFCSADTEYTYFSDFEAVINSCEYSEDAQSYPQYIQSVLDNYQNAYYGLRDIIQSGDRNRIGEAMDYASDLSNLYNVVASTDMTLLDKETSEYYSLVTSNISDDVVVKAVEIAFSDGEDLFEALLNFL